MDVSFRGGSFADAPIWIFVRMEKESKRRESKKGFVLLHFWGVRLVRVLSKKRGRWAQRENEMKKKKKRCVFGKKMGGEKTRGKRGKHEVLMFGQ